MAARKPAPDARLASSVKAIFAACRSLDIDDDTRREMLRKIAGVSSSKDLTYDQCAKVLDHLRSVGAINPRDGRRRSTPSPEHAPMRAKIEALLRELAQVTGEPKGIRYADGIARNNGWATCVDFCDADGLKNVITALQNTLINKQRKLHT